MYANEKCFIENIAKEYNEIKIKTCFDNFFRIVDRFELECDLAEEI